MAAVAPYPWRPLGELLVERLLLTADELDAALAEQRRSGRLLGHVLVEWNSISPEQLTCVLAEQYGVQLEVLSDRSGPSEQSPAPGSAATAPRPLGRLLLEGGHVTTDELDRALKVQRSTGRRLGEILVDHGSVSWATVAAAVAEQHGVAHVDVGALGEVEAPARSPALPGPAPAPVYEVRERHAALFRTDSFLEATDFAFEHLEGDPPELTIVRMTKSAEEEVWTYSAALADAQAESPGLVHQFGFDVTRWTGPPPTRPPAGR
jgi:hypothetical protein